jgi:hypothetical protein
MLPAKTTSPSAGAGAGAGVCGEGGAPKHSLDDLAQRASCTRCSPEPPHPYILIEDSINQAIARSIAYGFSPLSPARTAPAEIRGPGLHLPTLQRGSGRERFEVIEVRSRVIGGGAARVDAGRAKTMKGAKKFSSNGVRTHDLQINSLTLYQLSYGRLELCRSDQPGWYSWMVLFVSRCQHGCSRPI